MIKKVLVTIKKIGDNIFFDTEDIISGADHIVATDKLRHEAEVALATGQEEISVYVTEGWVLEQSSSEYPNVAVVATAYSRKEVQEALESLLKEDNPV